MKNGFKQDSPQRNDRKDRRDRNDRIVFLSLFSIGLLLIGLNIPIVRTQSPVVGIAEGDILVYKLYTQVSSGGEYGDDHSYEKYVITSIPALTPPFDILATVYLSETRTFGETIETNVPVTTIDTAPMVGSLIIDQNSVFSVAPSEISAEVYTRRLDLEEDLPIESMTIDFFTVLAHGRGYTAEVTLITEKKTTWVSTDPDIYGYIYKKIGISMTAYYSSTGICLREDVSAMTSIYEKVMFPIGQIASTHISKTIEKRIQPGLSTPAGLHELPWISTGTWILIGVSVLVTIGIGIWAVTQYKKQKIRSAIMIS